MEVRAYAKAVRISPRKVNLVADAIRKMPLEDAMAALVFVDKRGASYLSKLLTSAVANAVNNAKLDRANLQIAQISVTPSPALKRYHPSTRGRIHPYKKRGSNITIVLAEKPVKVIAPVSKVTEKKEKQTKEEAK